MPPEPSQGQLTDPARPPGGDAGEPWQPRFGCGEVPEDAPLPVMMILASRLMGGFYGETVRRAGVRMSPAGLGVLRLLVAKDGLKSSEVAVRAGSSPGTITAVVNTLTREGYVKRRPDASDRRVIRLYLTSKGRAACDAYTEVAGPMWRHAFDFLSDEDEPVVRRFFVEMIRNFSKLASEGGGA